MSVMQRAHLQRRSKDFGGLCDCIQQEQLMAMLATLCFQQLCDSTQFEQRIVQDAQAQESIGIRWF